MDPPGPAIAQQDRKRFVPPFCPRKDCDQHSGHSAPFRYSYHGQYENGRGRWPRFRCRACGSTFSMLAFSPDYWNKRPELTVPIVKALVAGSAFRQIGRTLGCSHATVAHRARRFGRHALLLQNAALAEMETIDRAVVIDGFVSFAHSQYFPCELITPVLDPGRFTLGAEPAMHRRGGKLTPAQKRRQKTLDETCGKVRRGAIRRAYKRVLERIGVKTSAQFVSDDHPAYRQHERHPLGRRIPRRVYPNPKRGPKGSPRSRAARERDRAMFEVDTLHAMIRHSLAHHRRETIAFSRRHNDLALLLLLLIAWRNFVKDMSERKPTGKTPAMAIGLTHRPWSIEQMIGRRLFPNRLELDDAERELYERRLETPAITTNRTHELKFAY